MSSNVPDAVGHENTVADPDGHENTQLDTTGPEHRPRGEAEASPSLGCG